MRLSYSSISTYKKCPMAYRFQYVEKRPTAPSPALSFGQSVHEALRWFYDVPTCDPCSAEKLLDYLDECWVSDGYASREEETRYYFQARSVLELFYRNNIDEFRLPIALEQRFSIDLGFCNLTGIIDRVDKLPSGDFEIIDYKTNRRLPPARILSRDLQLPLYHLASERTWEISPSRVTFYYLMMNHRHSMVVTPQRLESVLEEIESVAESIGRGDFEPRKNPLCPWCDFKEDCPLFEGEIITGNKASSLPELEVGQAVDELLSSQEKMNILQGRIDALKSIVGSYLERRGIDRVGGNRGLAFIDGDGEISCRRGEEP